MKKWKFTWCLVWISLRGRRSKGKGKGIRVRDNAQGKAYSGTLTRREIVQANASLGELRRDKEKLSLPISCEFVRVKAS